MILRIALFGIGFGTGPPHCFCEFDQGFDQPHIGDGVREIAPDQDEGSLRVRDPSDLRPELQAKVGLPLLLVRPLQPPVAIFGLQLFELDLGIVQLEFRGSKLSPSDFHPVD